MRQMSALDATICTSPCTLARVSIFILRTTELLQLLQGHGLFHTDIQGAMARTSFGQLLMFAMMVVMVSLPPGFFCSWESTSCRNHLVILIVTWDGQMRRVEVGKRTAVLKILWLVSNPR